MPFLELTFDGSQNVSGITYWRAGGRIARAAIKKGAFHPSTHTLRLEGNAPSLDGEGEAHYLIEGRLDNEVLGGTFDCGGLKGCITFTRLAAPTRA